MRLRTKKKIKNNQFVQISERIVAKDFAPHTLRSPDQLLRRPIVKTRDVPECVFEFRPEPEPDFQFRPEPDRNFDCAILHLRNMVFALYHHLCYLFIQKGCSPNSETNMKKKEADFFQKLTKNFYFFAII